MVYGVNKNMAKFVKIGRQFYAWKKASLRYPQYGYQNQSLYNFIVLLVQHIHYLSLFHITSLNVVIEHGNEYHIKPCW